MTTYEFKSGLRLGLMKLASSLSSPAGSPRNASVDLRYPEERMAARLIERLGLMPPIDVEKLCRSFADLSFTKFPVDIDGLCLDLKRPGKRPSVWVSTDLAPVRRRFTLAHEIGHIVIPWHTGTIIDDIDAPRSKEKSRYLEMEAEANRFAAELLMPSSWVAGLSERSEHAAGLMHSVHEIAQVSFPAAFLRTVKFGKAGFIGAKVRDGVVIQSARTSGTNSLAPEAFTLLQNVDMPAAYEPKIVHGSDAQYYWWETREVLLDPGGNLPEWRTVLDAVLLEIPSEFRSRTRSSVNAIIGRAIGREPKGSPVARIFKHGMEALQNRERESTWVKYVLSHPKSKDYVLARARERANDA